jgi:hypothetical protein
MPSKGNPRNALGECYLRRSHGDDRGPQPTFLCPHLHLRQTLLETVKKNVNLPDTCDENETDILSVNPYAAPSSCRIRFVSVFLWVVTYFNTSAICAALSTNPSISFGGELSLMPSAFQYAYSKTRTQYISLAN